MYYLVLDNENYCFGMERWDNVPQSTDLRRYMYVEDEIESMNLVGKKYENEVWVELPPEPMPVPEPTEEEIVQAELLLNQLLMQEKLNSIDEVNAQILLNTMGGI